MQWAAFLLFIISSYTSYKCYLFTQKNDSLKFMGLSIAALVLAITQLSLVIDGLLGIYDLTLYSGVIVEWGHIIALAFVLSSLSIFIRQSKPVFAQFPLVYTALPLLIIFSYFLVQNTYALKEWLLSIYQGGAILVAMLMYAIYTYREDRYKYILAGIIFFLITFIMFWYIPGIRDTYSWTWKSLLGLSLATTLYGYEHAQEEHDSKRASLQS